MGIYAHDSWHGGTMGHVGTYTNHQLSFVCNATQRAVLTTAGSLSTDVQGTLWGATNDGAGSGLDADTVDGLQASSFLRSDANDTGTNITLSSLTLGDATLTHSTSHSWKTLTIQNAGDNNEASIHGLDSTGAQQFLVYGGGGSQGFLSSAYAWRLKLPDSGSFTRDNTHTLWDSGNDGSGSGLDADLLDGTELSAIKTNSSTDSNAIWIRNDAPTIYFRDTNHRGAMLHNNSNLMYILRGNQATDSTSWGTVNNMWPVYWNLTNNDAIFGGNITAQYNITAYSSDERLKTNIKPIENAIDKVKQIKGVTFDWNDKADELGFKPETKFNDVGLIAQDVEKVMPQLVKLAPFDTFSPEPNSKEDQSHKMGTSKSGENYKTIQYDRVCALLVEAIKEQQAQIEELKDKLK
jgi:hypothetical protein